MPSDIFLQANVMSVRYSRDVMGTVHDVRLMHGSHALATVSLRIVERVTRNAFRSIPSDELDRLNNAVDDLRRVLVKCSRRRHTRIPRARCQSIHPQYSLG